MIPALYFWLLVVHSPSVAAPPASRSGPELDLQWEAPPECPSQADIEHSVLALLGRPLRDSEAPIHVRARVAEDGGALVLHLRTENPEGARERVFPGQSCDVLAETTALVIATALDSSLAFGEPDTPAPTSAIATDNTAIASNQEPTVPDSPAVEAVPQARVLGLGGAVRASAAGNVGPLPTIAPGIELSAALLHKRTRVELRFAQWLPRRVSSSVRDDAGGEIDLWTLGVRGCWVPSASVVEFPLCGGIASGLMRGEGVGLGAPATTRLPWLAIDGGAAVTVRPVPYLGVWLGADVIVPITRPGFRIDDLGLVHRAGPVGGQAVLGIEARFGATDRNN